MWGRRISRLAVRPEDGRASPPAVAPTRTSRPSASQGHGPLDSADASSGGRPGRPPAPAAGPCLRRLKASSRVPSGSSIATTAPRDAVHHSSPHSSGLRSARMVPVAADRGPFRKSRASSACGRPLEADSRGTSRIPSPEKVGSGSPGFPTSSSHHGRHLPDRARQDDAPVGLDRRPPASRRRSRSEPPRRRRPRRRASRRVAGRTGRCRRPAIRSAPRAARRRSPGPASARWRPLRLRSRRRRLSRRPGRRSPASPPPGRALRAARNIGRVPCRCASAVVAPWPYVAYDPRRIRSIRRLDGSQPGISSTMGMVRPDRARALAVGPAGRIELVGQAPESLLRVGLLDHQRRGRACDSKRTAGSATAFWYQNGSSGHPAFDGMTITRSPSWK